MIDEADAANPNQAAVLNLRGEVLLEQKDFDRRRARIPASALKADPKLRDAQYNLAQVPFKKKDYTKARERFEQLFATTSGADKDRAAQLVKFKVYLTYLLEGKDARAQKMMEQFQFTGDTPALYYAQAAWEFKHDNAPKANDWVNSARKIYPPALNGVFADAFFDLGWLQIPTAERLACAGDRGRHNRRRRRRSSRLRSRRLLSRRTSCESHRSADAGGAGEFRDPRHGGDHSHAEASPGASSALATSSPSVETPTLRPLRPRRPTPVLGRNAPVPADAISRRESRDGARAGAGA